MTKADSDVSEMLVVRPQASVIVTPNTCGVLTLEVHCTLTVHYSGICLAVKCYGNIPFTIYVMIPGIRLINRALHKCTANQTNPNPTFYANIKADIQEM